jgi:hypothetical protein
MSELIPCLLRCAYVADALLLIALTDRIKEARPLAQAFTLLASTAVIGLVIGTRQNDADTYVYAAMFAAAPALCTWSVLATCSKKSFGALFTAVAFGSWLVSVNLPHDEHQVQLLGVLMPAWRRTAGIYWCGVWTTWALVTIGGFVAWLRAPIRSVHVIAALVAISLATEAVGILAWAVNPAWYTITRTVDLVLGTAVGTVTGYALWKTRAS